MTAVTQAAGLVAFPVAAAALGATVATLRRPGPRLVSAIQHFAAGVVIAALVGEVLPDLRREGRLPASVAGFVLGVAVMLGLAAYGRRVDQARERGSTRADTPMLDTRPDLGPGSGTGPRPDPARGVRTGSLARPVTRAAGAALPIGLLVAVGIDLLIDGMLVGLGASLGATEGLILTIALTLEILFLSLSLVAELTDSGLSRTRSAAICAGLGLLTAVGAIGGAAALSGASPAVLAAVLAFGAAALLYLAVEELLVEAHEQAETTGLAAMFFLGFLLIYVLGELGG
ncbi:ZIP family metal transporter [Terrabacter sp. C0L_2]|uniref:ZIP family metal transporter n=1 Tax=Terrabacter sp. C0L_2 TaxID=3108389 RepID=UPI0017B90328|nr:ZIP family metal transporter [Dermatophilaceae bacterium]WVM95452.1 ZIP family metal transporter [Terrabacter sp. C0L_2]